MKKLLFVTLFFSTAASFAASYTWNGGSGDWSVAGNWTPMTGPPGAGDTATINGGTATVSADTSVDTLNLNGGTVDGTAMLTVNSMMNWTSGSMNGPGGRTVIAASAILNVDSTTDKHITSRALENAGTVIYTGNGPGGLQFHSGAICTNRSMATFEVQGNATISADSASSRFDNVGTFLKSSGSGTNLIVVSLNNYGVMEVQTGGLRFDSALNSSGSVNLTAAGTVLWLRVGGSASGPFNAASGALVDFLDYTLAPGAQLNGDGLYRIKGGTVTLNNTSPLTVHKLDLVSSGTLDGTGTVVVDQLMNWLNYAPMKGPGRTVIAAGAILNVDSAEDKHITSRALENAGTVIYTGNGPGGLQFHSGAICTNRSMATFEVQGNATISADSASSRFDNVGTFLKSSGSGTNLIVVSLNNYGVMEVQTGGLRFDSALNSSGSVNLTAAGTVLWLRVGGSASGPFNAASGALVDFLDYTLAPGAQLNGDGLYRIKGGTVTLNNTSPLTVHKLDLVSSGTLDGTGTVVVDQLMNWLNYAPMKGPGRTVIAAGAILNVDSAEDKHITSRALENAGTVIYTGNGPGGLQFHSGAICTNRSMATFEVQGNATISADSASSRFDNVGTFLKSSGSGTNLIVVSLNNYGVMEVQTGGLRFDSALNSSGSVNLTAAGTVLWLRVGGSASGPFNAASGALVDFLDYTLAPGAQLNGDGLYRIKGGTVTLNNTSPLTVHKLDLVSSGTLDGTGTVVVDQLMNWLNYAPMKGPGRTVIAAGAILNVDSAEDKHITSRALENAGTVIYTGNGPGGLQFHSGAICTNRSMATFEVQGNATISADSASSRFDNVGTFVKLLSTGTTTISVPFNNYGTLDLQSGIVLLTGSYSPSAGASLKVTIGGLTPGTQFSQLQVAGTASLDGHLNIALANGFVPGASDEFLVLTCASRLGTFATANSQPLGPRTFLNPVYLANGVKLVVADAAGNFTSAQYNPNTHQSRIMMAGIAGQSYVIEASADLADWIPILTSSVPGSTVLDFVDPDSPLYSQRFYRALFEP